MISIFLCEFGTLILKSWWNSFLGSSELFLNEKETSILCHDFNTSQIEINCTRLQAFGPTLFPTAPLSCQNESIPLGVLGRSLKVKVIGNLVINQVGRGACPSGLWHILADLEKQLLDTVQSRRMEKPIVDIHLEIKIPFHCSVEEDGRLNHYAEGKEGR